MEEKMTEKNIETKQLSDADVIRILALDPNMQPFVYEKAIKVIDPIDGKCGEMIFGLKEISGSEYDYITQQAITVNKINRAGEPEISMNQQKANDLLLKVSLVKAPFPITEDRIKRLPKKVKQQLIEFANEINSIKEDDEKK